MEEKEIKNSLLSECEDNTIAGICQLLAEYEGNICNHIADFVSSLCGVEKKLIFSNSQIIDVTQARGLFFYAYRYATGCTYDKIGRITKEMYGKRFSEAGVNLSVARMSELIEKNHVWNKRWSILKHIIKSQSADTKEQPIPITIKVPKNVEVIIKKE